MDRARFSQIVHTLMDPDAGTAEDRSLILAHLSMLEGGDQIARDLIAAAPAHQMREIRERMESFAIEARMPPIDDVLKAVENR